ncbi:hypothetical protein DFP72DRAFT_901982 [Ephemerocybe angulata]|uniref:Uncharacterized protein n=1 Tax=Ephemerocybe angulata TaxID=980116 RepID=A0A8H6M586_9AGAR|nr:hypothetical protein DFP72DRAFT_901982 [Tulosesus angulatus]
MDPDPLDRPTGSYPPLAIAGLNSPESVELDVLTYHRQSSSSISNRITANASTELWHPKVTPYRAILSAVTLGLGIAKAVLSSQDGGTRTSVTIEWVSGVVVTLLAFFISQYEAKESAYPQWLFKTDMVMAVRPFLRRLGITIPRYSTEERTVDPLIKPKHPSVTGYRILVTGTAISLGLTKAIVAYLGHTTVPTTLEWIYGILVTLSLYWLGLYELSTKEVMPYLFITDYSQEASTTILASIFIIGHIAVLYPIYIWTSLWYQGVKGILEPGSDPVPNVPPPTASDRFFERILTLVWIVMASGLGIGSGVVGFVLVCVSLSNVLSPVALRGGRLLYKVVRSIPRRILPGRMGGDDDFDDDDETLINTARYKGLVDIIKDTILKLTRLKGLKIALYVIFYCIAHTLAFIIAFGWLTMWFYGLKNIWVKGSGDAFTSFVAIFWSFGACIALLIGSCGTIAIVASFFSPLFLGRNIFW